MPPSPSSSSRRPPAWRPKPPLFTGFATRRAAVTTAAPSDAVAADKVTLRGLVDLGAANAPGDPAAVGNPLDHRIEARVAALAINAVSLADPAQTVAAASPAKPTPPPATSCPAWLPAKLLLLQPAAAN
jgi:hypothetical protein